MIKRDQAFILIKKYLKNEENIKFALSVEAILREIAKRLHRDEEIWGLTGLLHNLDYEFSIGNLENRGKLSAQLLEGLLPEKSVNAIKAINYMHTDYIPVTSLDKSLIATEAVTNFIMITSINTSTKKIQDLDINLLIEKFNDPTFATRINRSRIELCVDIGVEIETFLDFSLKVLKKNADQIGFLK